MTVPAAQDGSVSPCCESTAGQKLLLVDLIKV